MRELLSPLGVPVNKGEIENIASHLGMTAEEVTRLYTDPEPDARASRILLNSGEGCVFLDGNLFMIYEGRPQTCRHFPHVAVGTHSLGGRPSSLARWAALCPIIYNALESYKHLTGCRPHPAFKPRTCPPADREASRPGTIVSSSREDHRPQTIA